MPAETARQKAKEWPEADAADCRCNAMWRGDLRSRRGHGEE
jgi:hypothetical protein